MTVGTVKWHNRWRCW